jgi:hypothetical protein
MNMSQKRAYEECLCIVLPLLPHQQVRGLQTRAHARCYMGSWTDSLITHPTGLLCRCPTAWLIEQ